jgi:hypothetical protein
MSVITFKRFGIFDTDPEAIVIVSRRKMVGRIVYRPFVELTAKSIELSFMSMSSDSVSLLDVIDSPLASMGGIWSQSAKQPSGIERRDLASENVESFFFLKH